MADIFKPALEFAEKNPVITGLGVFVGGLALLFVSGFFKPKATDQTAGLTAGSSTDAAYYSAVVADAQTGAQLQTTQINAQASTAQALAADQSNVTIQSTWASTQEEENANNNSTSLALAPYQVQSNELAALSAIAAAPPVTTTTTTKTGGNPLLGAATFGLLGGSKSKTTTSVTASPNAVMALQELQSLGFSAGH